MTGNQDLEPETLREAIHTPDQQNSQPVPDQPGAGLAKVPEAPWHPALRLIYRPVFCLAIMLLIKDYFSFLFNWAIPWVATNLLFLTEPVVYKPSGSGDTLYDYVQLLTCILFGLGLSLVWTLLDARRKQYLRSWELLRLYLRYQLAMMMFSYGFAKVFVLQFGTLGLSTLLQPMGEMSPMGLLWNFMAFSPAYTRFTGVLEVLAGALLLFRRTTLLGSLLCVAVMGHVLMLNLCYDVPVKLFSAQLIFQSLLLMAPDLGRLTGFFLLGRTVASRPEPSIVRNPSRRRAALLFKGLVIGIMLLLNVAQINYSHKPDRPVLYGVYEVERFISDKQELQPYKDPLRWERLVVEWPGVALLKLANGMEARIGFKPHEARRSILIAPDYKAPKFSKLKYELLGGERVRFQGEYEGHQLDITLIRKGYEDFPLTSRGFHWINELPFNR